MLSAKQAFGLTRPDLIPRPCEQNANNHTTVVLEWMNSGDYNILKAAEKLEVFFLKWIYSWLHWIHSTNAPNIDSTFKYLLQGSYIISDILVD